MKVYLAAQYPRRDEMRHVAKLLREHNIEVTSRWLLETDSLDSVLHKEATSKNLQLGIQDRADIDASDTLVLFAEDPNIGFKRGTRHVEYGYALGKGKRLVVIDGPENVFQYFPEVVHYATLQDFLDAEGIQNASVAD